MVRWHLMRDWHACLQVPQSHITSVQTQAILAWTMAGNQQDASHLWVTERKRPAEERWHSALILLESRLCDAALITARLRTLLRYRMALQVRDELQASSFTPLLVLVQNERQAEIWRCAARQAARWEKSEPLAGAIAQFNEGENVWQWPWRDLATGVQLRLAPRFASLTPGSLPEGALAHLVAVQDLIEPARENPRH